MNQSDRYHYTESGLDYIYLINGFEYVETPRGKGVTINDLEGLHRAIGKMLVQERASLTGKEFRFLRHELNLTQRDLAALIGVNTQTIARIEKRRVGSPDGPSQRLLRCLYREHINGNAEICKHLRLLAELDEILFDEEDVNFQEIAEGWQNASQAA